MKILGEDKLATSLPVCDLVALVRERAENDCDKTYISFLEDGETVSNELTAGALEIRARAIAAFLQERRLAGERAILIYPPGLDYVEAFYGCLFAGVWVDRLRRRPLPPDDQRRHEHHPARRGLHLRGQHSRRRVQ